MSYTTAITNRTATDITNRTSKAYFNVADWNRIYNNAQLVNALATIKLNQAILFTTLSEPTISTIPSITNFNALLANIERVRLAMVGLIPSLIEIKNDWIAGVNQSVFNYTHVNQWESALDSVWVYWGGPGLPVCPILSSNLTVATGNSAIYVDCLDTADYNIDLQGTGKLYII
jgi:hypothetical protein